MASSSFTPGMGYKAIDNYKATNQSDALHFEEGQTIVGLHISDDNKWLYGEIGNKRGWFPTEKTVRIQSEQTPILPPRNLRKQEESAIYLDPNEVSVPLKNEPRLLVRTDSVLSGISNISDLTVDDSIPQPKTATDYANAVDGALKQLELQQQVDFQSTDTYVEITTGPSLRGNHSQTYINTDEPYYMRMSPKPGGLNRPTSFDNIPIPSKSGKSFRSCNKVINYVTYPRVDRGHTSTPLRDLMEFSYCDHFWSDKEGGKSGFDVLLEKQQLGREMFQQMSKVIRDRAAVEETYAKSLLRISKTNLGMDEAGTLGAVWRDIVRSVEEEAEVHRLWAFSLVDKGRKELMAYAQKVRDGTRKATERVTKKRKLLQGRYNAIDRAMKKVSEKEEKLKSSRTNAAKQRATTEFDQAEDELNSTIKSYNEAQGNWISEMVRSSLEMERFEEQRVELMKTSFGIYISDRIKVAEQLDRSTEWLDGRIQTIDPRLDRKEFVLACGTGTLRPTDFTMDV
ncbi:growth arrest-specific protein 7-like [Anneissia japonica]|uniref:growth arrest-specific protein 7-like n=1 Tax=Anneissia japonica TaxID=1529436 RepID=UPI00142570A6|nr:growth arrest-specific protein 7-like [Anneissia japonica]